MNEPSFYLWSEVTPDSPRGPFTLAELRAMMKAGEIEPDALVAQPGAADWKPVAGVVLAVQKPTRGAPGHASGDSIPHLWLGMPPQITSTNKEPPATPPEGLAQHPNDAEKAADKSALMGIAFLVIFLLLFGLFAVVGVTPLKSRFDGSHSEAMKCLADLRAGCKVGASYVDLLSLHKRLVSALNLNSDALSPDSPTRLLLLLDTLESAWKAKIEYKKEYFEGDSPDDTAVLKIFGLPAWRHSSEEVVASGLTTIEKECSKLMGGD